MVPNASIQLQPGTDIVFTATGNQQTLNVKQGQPYENIESAVQHHERYSPKHRLSLLDVRQQDFLISRYLETGRFKNKFETICEVGRGGFGTVYKVRYLLDNNIYAIKKVKLHLGHKETLKDHKVYREIQAITMLDPKHIIRYYTSWVEALDDEERVEEERMAL